MNKKVFSFDVDLKKKTYQTINPKQGETGSALNISLLDDGIPYDIPTGITIQVMFKRPDGFISYIAGTNVSGNSFDIDLTNQILNKAGEVRAEVIISDTFSVKTQTFHFNVLESVGYSEIESVNELDILEQLVQNASQEVIDRIEALESEVTIWYNEAQASEDTREENENTRIGNENTRQTQESTRQFNETDRETAETTRVENEDARIIAETGRETEESTRVANEDDRISSENTRETNEGIRVANEAERVSSEDTRVSSETNRQSNEATRESNESTRQSNESIRESNETARVTSFQNIEDDYSEYRFRGDYDPTTQYYKNNTVRNNGSTYIAVSDSLGQSITDTLYWELVAIKGADGDGSGDMVKSTYDSNESGIVDDSEKLGGNTLAQVRAGTTKEDVGLGNVSNDLQATKLEFEAHKSEIMPHQFIDEDSGKVYRYGRRYKDGGMQVIYEEVI